MRIPFGEYLPDQPPYDNAGLTVASNCLPISNHFRSMRGLQRYSNNGLNGVCKGFFVGRDKSGNVYTYAGDTSDLFSMVNSSFTAVSRTAGGAYNVGSNDHWEFAQWGERVVATDYADAVQMIDFGATAFSSLSGCVSKARHLAVVGDFLVLGNVTDYSSGVAMPNRVQWSGLDNIGTWAPSASTQADGQTLYGDGGWIQRIVGGTKGIIVQERSIWQMSYIGAPYVFRFDEIEPGKGTPAPMSVVIVGSNFFYLGQDDFYIFSNSVSANLGHGKVYQTFIDSVDQSNIHRVYGMADMKAPIIFWAYPSTDAINGNPDKILVYNYVVNKWAGPINVTIELLCNMRAEGYTLDTLDTLNASVDALPYSLDATAYMGGTLNFGAMDTGHYLNTFNGADLTAVFETGDRQIEEGKKYLINIARPMVEGVSASASVAVSGRVRTKDPISYGPDVAVNSEGEAPVDNEARYHRFRTTVADGFTHASGIEVYGGVGGEY